ncbi:MAG: hypothetical protein JW849_11135 [Phycisphaerae bacterium]|nr:hypothetical protein [Phycisphaerae bacterium]
MIQAATELQPTVEGIRAVTQPVNCWEFMQCGREPGGRLARELGICPAARKSPYDSENEGRFAGRACWKVFGTFCEGHVERSMTRKALHCIDCPFAQKVAEEQGLDFNP